MNRSLMSKINDRLETVLSLVLAVALVVAMVPLSALADELVGGSDEPAVVETTQQQEPAAEVAQPAAVEPAAAAPAKPQAVDPDAQDATDDAAAPAGEATESEAPDMKAAAAKDVYIDNTVDNSKTYVTGTLHITGSGGTQAGCGEGKTIYNEVENVTYSNPKTARVQGRTDDAYTKVYKAAKDIKDRGKDGEFQMSVSESTGKVWDNRKYTTVEDGDAVLIGDSDYLQGAYGVSDEYTRTHIASGEYGKETFILVEANGWVSGWDIKVSVDEGGTASSDLEASLAEETVTLTAEPAEGYLFKEWQVVSGGAELASATAASTTFTMPEADVEVKATFVPEHKHVLTKTDEVPATCEEEGAEAY